MKLQFFPSAASLIPHSFFDKMQAQKLEVLPRLRGESDMTNGCSSIDRGNSAADKSVHLMLAFRLSALVLFAAAAFSTQGEVLVYDGFHSADYNNVAADKNVEASTTFTAGHTIGIGSSKWNKMSGTQIRVFGENYGLSIPQAMADFGFTAIGGSIGCNPGSNNSQMRAMYHALDSGALHASAGTNLYVRMLLNLDANAAGKLTARDELVTNAGNYYACGFCIAPSGDNYHLLTYTRSAIAFLLWKNSNNQYVLSFGHTTAAGTTATFYPLVTGITLGETYVCYAEIQVDADADANEIVRAGAVAASSFTGAAPWTAIGGDTDSIQTQLISAAAYPTVMAVAGPYGTNNGCFRADEIVVGTEMKDILPVGGVFAVSPSGTPTIGMDSFSTDWVLVADDGVTADASLVWSTDESFATATTNSLGTGLAAGTRTASLPELEPNTTYWWKIYADNGTDVAETVPDSFTTPGAPILGAATATVTEESAAFSIALVEAALQNTLATSVSIFYGTDGETWTELPLGSSEMATNFSEIVECLGYGLKYKWFARATATLANARILSVDTTTNSFTTVWGGEMYVDVAATNAITPYSTPETAAKAIATALSVAADGAKIHVAPGRYNVSMPISLAKAVEIVGDNEDPSRVVVSNTSGVAWGNTNHRCVLVNNPNARISGMTFENGKDYGNGGNVRIDTDGGVVTNCILSGGFTREGNDSAGANVAITGPGLVTHCKIFGGDQNNCGGGDRVSSVYLEHENARIENCLVKGFKGATVSTQPTVGCAGILVNKGAAVNCTVADCTSPYTTASGFAGIQLWANGVATNCVSVSNVDSNGTVRAFMASQVSRTSHCAFDAIAGETTIPEGMPNAVVGTAASFFKDYANGDYTLNPTSMLVNAGINYEGMASVDLAGKARKSGKIVDIGCYEHQMPNGFFIVVR